MRYWLKMRRIIQRDRSIIPACDIPLEIFQRIIEGTCDIGEVGAYKCGVSFLDVGLETAVKIVREKCGKPFIYDHQKAGTDIHESSPDQFMDAMVRANVNAVILFPQAGPITEYEWIAAAQERNLGVIVGGEMTHPRFLDGDLSNSKKRVILGYLDSGVSKEIYQDS